MIDDAPLPDTGNPLEAPFWAALARGELKIQHCDGCGIWLFPTRIRCGTCGEPPVWKTVSGRGRIWSFTLVHPPVLPAFAPYAPYPVVVVELEEQQGLRMVGNLLFAPGDAINVVPVEKIRIGLPVMAVSRDIGEGVHWPAWRLIGEEG